MEKRFELMGLLDRFRKVSSVEKPVSIEVQAVPITGVVTMKGDGFVSFVSQGQSVVAGEPLMFFDRSKVMAAGFSDTVITVVTNSYDYKQVSAIDARDVHAGQKNY